MIRGASRIESERAGQKWPARLVFGPLCGLAVTNYQLLTQPDAAMRSTILRLAAVTFLAAPAVTAAQQTVFARPAAQGPDAAPLPSVTLPPELDRVLREYEQAWTRRDAAGLAALFTSDGFVLNSGRPPIRGTEDVKELYRTTSGSPLALRALAYSTSDSVGYIVGGFARSRNTPDGGNFILLLRRTGKAPWKIAADMDNANRRPGG
jgi:hypothetical protein